MTNALEEFTKSEMRMKWDLKMFVNTVLVPFQVILGNDQNTSPTNKKTAGSRLERTS